jgi:polysaccharide biosynthesis protein PslH
MKTLSHERYDLVVASQLPMAAYYPYFQNVPALFDEMEFGLILDNVHSTDRRTRLRHAFTWFKLRRYLSKLLFSFEACTVVSEQERHLFRENFPVYKKTIEVIPNCMSIDDYKDLRVDPRPNTLIFTGSFRYQVNYEAMQWFTGKVFPLVLDETPDAELTITGDHLELPLPSQKNIRLTGYVSRIGDWIATSAVAIAPILSGGGTRLKILEAMAIGVPVVATSKGAEGLNAVHGEHLFIADSPQDFAAHITNLMSDRALANRIASSARTFVKSNFDRSVVMPRFLNLVEQTAAV